MGKSLEGKKAPSFRLPDRDDNKVALKDFDSDYLIVYFYPKDSTPGCTVEANEFNKALAKLKRLKAGVVGISGGDAKSKTKFCDKHGLKFPLLSDSDFSVSKKFNSYGKKSFMGKTFDGILRKTFVLDSNRKVIKEFDKVKPAEHVNEVIEVIKEHRASA